MTAATAIGAARRKTLALLSYLTLLTGILFFVIVMTSNLWSAWASLRESREALAHLDRQSQLGALAGSSVDTAIATSPFLSGRTVTIAGAALQECVETAVRKAGGNVMSSQIDLKIPRAEQGFIGLNETFEIKQAGLQPLLYDLEAGMPYLFIDSLAIQSPQAFGEVEGAGMRVVIGVTGQWR
jgi:general secretion pathway protein M